MDSQVLDIHHQISLPGAGLIMSHGTQAQRDAHQNILAFGDGESATLRRWTETTDPVAGTTSREIGQTVTARAYVDKYKEAEREGLRGDEKKILLSGQDIDAAGASPVDVAWTVQGFGFDDSEVVGPIVSHGNGTVTAYWEIMVRPGSVS